MPLEMNSEVHLIFLPQPHSWFCPWGDSGVGWDGEEDWTLESSHRQTCFWF